MSGSGGGQVEARLSQAEQGQPRVCLLTIDLDPFTEPVLTHRAALCLRAGPAPPGHLYCRQHGGAGGGGGAAQRGAAWDRHLGRHTALSTAGLRHHLCGQALPQMPAAHRGHVLGCVHTYLSQRCWTAQRAGVARDGVERSVLGVLPDILFSGVGDLMCILNGSFRAPVLFRAPFASGLLAAVCSCLVLRCRDFGPRGDTAGDKGIHAGDNIVLSPSA